MSLPNKILLETIDNMNLDNTELRAINAQLRDALKSVLADPRNETSLSYAEYVLEKSEREIGRKYYHYE
jgi:hypothetical protein